MRLFFTINLAVKTTKNGNDTRMLLRITLNENGYIDNTGKIFKNSILAPNGIAVAIEVNNFTSPPPHKCNCHNRYAMEYVITIEIIEARMNLMLVEINDKIRFETRPKAIRI